MASESEGEDAPSYSDATTLVYDRSGSVMGGLTSWYLCFGITRFVCFGGVQNKECCRVLPSKDWDEWAKDAPLAGRERWRCHPSCGTKYSGKWGQLVRCHQWNPEEKRMDEMYMRAECLPCDVPMDLYHDNVAMPMDLHNKVLRMVPAKKHLLVPDPTLPGKMMLTCKEDFDALPEFSWWEIFTIMGVAVPEGVKRH